MVRTQRTQRGAQPQVDRHELLVIRGRASTRFAIPRRGQLVLGRAPEADVVLDGSRVSRRHAILHCSDGGLELEDLDSANGTIVRQAKLAPRVRNPIEPGDTIHLGEYLVVVNPCYARDGEGERGEPAIVAEATATRDLLEEVSRVAEADISVLLLGETGVGKDVIAARLHAQSSRHGRPFVRINCAALNESLLESELFGHEKGAFTGAVQAKPGLLEAAGDGTVFLDEIGELPSRLQPKLLHALETRQVPRVGGLSARPIAARFIAATNRELPAEMAAGNFRSDLFYRLATFVIRIPPLRDRVDDIVPLARRFLSTAAARSGLAAPPTLRDDAVAALLAHPWPGNIRELRNVIERVLVMAQGRPITAAELALVAPVAAPPPVAPSLARDGVAERARIIQALVDAHGNQSAAARVLGMSRGTLLSRLDAYQIARPRKRPITPS